MDMVYVNDHTKPHWVCDEKYWMGPAKAVGWIPQDPVCAADSACTDGNNNVSRDKPVEHIDMVIGLHVSACTSCTRTMRI